MVSFHSQAHCKLITAGYSTNNQVLKRGNNCELVTETYSPL